MNSDPQKTQYINFPIVLLDGAFKNLRQTCIDIYDFALYEIWKDNHEKNQKYTFLQASNHYSQIDFPGRTLETARKLYEKVPANNPKTGISIKTLMDFYHNTKSISEIETFIGFCAIRSILQKKIYCKVTNAFLLSRMAGKASTSENLRLPEHLRKYENRYHLDKLKTELQNNWGLKLYSYRSRGYYVSFKLTRADLISQVEKKRARNLKKQRIKEQNEILLSFQ